MLTLRRARQEQRHNVGTRDQQQQSDGAKEQPEGTARIADSDFLKRLNAYGEFRVGFGKLAAKLCLHSGEIRASLRGRDAGFESSNDDEPVVLPGRTVRKAGRNRTPQIGLAIGEADRKKCPQEWDTINRCHDWERGKKEALRRRSELDDHRGADFSRRCWDRR